LEAPGIKLVGNSVERSVNGNRCGISAGFATGLSATCTGIASGTLTAVAVANAVAVPPDAASGFTLLPELAECVSLAEAANWAFAVLFAVQLATACRGAADAVGKAGTPALDLARDNPVAPFA
jgi:hypothetical protein